MFDAVAPLCTRQLAALAGVADAATGTVPLYLRLLGPGVGSHVLRHALRAVDACLLRRALSSTVDQEAVVAEALETIATPATTSTSRADAEYLASLFRALSRVEELARARDDSRRTRALKDEQARLTGMVSAHARSKYESSFKSTRSGLANMGVEASRSVLECASSFGSTPAAASRPSMP